ncbi:MAG: transporter substrate-binding domain-containing protein [Geobacteraceae bacterium]|nr:transporter substrate-binding domain-containing protein [Geobacteraceae bacterium]
MKTTKAVFSKISLFLLTVAATTLLATSPALCRDLDEIRQQGVLRHLGVPYANFVTGSGDGMDVELVQLFAKHLGVRYEYVKTTWDNVVPDLIGRKIKLDGNNVELLDAVPSKGDIVANGFTVLPWREKILDFSLPTFPTQIMLVAPANSAIKPIKPSRNIHKDIERVKKLTKNRTTLGVQNTCLDPALYNLKEEGAKIKNFAGALSDLPSAIIKGESDTAIMEMPDALLALKKHPGKIKIIGPLSPAQDMAAGFAKESVQLRNEFRIFFAQIRKDGTYLKIVKKYYPSAPEFYPAFFK